VRRGIPNAELAVVLRLCAAQYRFMRRILVGLAAVLGFALFGIGAESPTPRSRAEVQAVLGREQGSSFALKPLRVCLVASQQDHGPGEHDYPAWQTNWTKLLGNAPRVWVTNAWQWPETFENIDVVILYFWNHAWHTNQTHYQQMDEFLARGGGLVVLHSATIADKEPEKLAERIGLAFQPGRSKYRHGPLDLTVVAPTEEPITRGLPRSLHFVDESYWPMFGETNRGEVAGHDKGGGKGLADDLDLRKRSRSRFHVRRWSLFVEPTTIRSFRVMVLRGIAWTAREPVGRLERLATLGVKFAD
jgi:hypothetical protein